MRLSLARTQLYEVIVAGDNDGASVVLYIEVTALHDET